MNDTTFKVGDTVLDNFDSKYTVIGVHENKLWVEQKDGRGNLYIMSSDSVKPWIECRTIVLEENLAKKFENWLNPAFFNNTPTSEDFNELYKAFTEGTVR